MKKILSMALAFMLSHTILMAVPAYPVKKTVRKADGTLVTVVQKGDENMSFYEATDGMRMRLLNDGRFEEISPEKFAAVQRAAQDDRQAADSRREARQVRRAPGQYTGKKKGLVILVHFSNNAFTVEDPNTAFRNFFNQDGYSGYGMAGSVKDYFKAQSYGQFELDFDVVGPYKLSKTMAYYGAANGDRNDSNPGAMIEEAVRAANAEVNYKDYDWDNDGMVDQIYVIYAGYGQHAGGDSNTIWPHESSIEHLQVKLDGKMIGTYACSCELRGVSGATLDGIGTACHEFSHCLGIRDHYDTNYGGNFGTSYYDLMNAGCYNGDGCIPAAYTSYERWVSGWLEPTEITTETQIDGMKPLTTSPEAYILYNKANRNEYYLLENRQLEGFDAALPGHGLMVFHINYDEKTWRGNTINTGSNEGMRYIAADGKYDDRSLSGDPFPGTRGVSALTDFTSPAAILFTANSDGVKLMHKAIERIVEGKDGLVSMLVARPNLGTPVLTEPTDVTTTGFTAHWNPVDRATKYELILTEIPNKADVADALLVEEDFSGCYSKTAGFQDVGKSLNQYLHTTGFQGSALYLTPDLLRIGTSTKSGVLQCPVLRGNETGDLTIVMTVKPAKEGTRTKGNVHVLTNTKGKEANVAFDVETQTTLVLHPEMVFDEVYRVDIEATTALYISYLALYDGNFSAAELGLEGATEKVKARAPHRVKAFNYTTTDNFYRFEGLSPACSYQLTVRSLNDEQESPWCAEKTYTLDLSPVETISVGTISDGRVYDLQGRQLNARPRAGLYIRNGRKFVK